MAMTRLYFFTLLVFSLLSSFSQEKKNYYSFFIGSHYSQNSGVYNKQHYYDCFVGENLKRNVVQSGRMLMDAGFLYHHNFKNNTFNMLFGLSYNQKGYLETGELSFWNENNWVPYVKQVKFNYYGLSVGCSYKVITRKKLILSIGELVNPEIMDAANWFNSGLKRFGVSAKTFATLERSLGNNSSVYLMPFYQIALGQYSNRVKSVSDNSYTPYSFGISLGLKH